MRFRKHRAVLAHVQLADVAATAFADAAFHPIFERRVDPVVGKPELFEHRKREFNHYRRSANDCDRIVARRSDLFEHGRYEAHAAFPVGSLAARIDRRAEADVRTRRPFVQFVFIDQVADPFSTAMIFWR